MRKLWALIIRKPFSKNMTCHRHRAGRIYFWGVVPCSIYFMWRTIRKRCWDLSGASLPERCASNTFSACDSPLVSVALSAERHFYCSNSLLRDKKESERAKVQGHKIEYSGYRNEDNTLLTPIIFLSILISEL